MRALRFGSVLVFTACATAPAPAPEPEEPTVAVAPAPAPVPEPVKEVLAADTPKTTAEGATFVAPAGWSITVRGPATILEPPEPESHIALIDVHAADSDAAIAAAWAAYLPDNPWKLRVAAPAPDKDGWTDIKGYEYETSPNEKRDVAARARRAGDVWTVLIYDMKTAVGEKRLGAVATIISRLLPKGYTRESFAGRKAATLDKARTDQLSTFVETAMKETGVPGVAFGLVQNGKVVFADGFGTKELGKKGKPDADTLFMIASNTKALTTLMLAKEVEEKKLTWDTPVTDVYPAFKLGDAET
ncbi:MAG TPA: serine hydrolase domain-containing protein, partial [Myxococcaceae bacterium]|nr:serine hydrolase domain-containing protein [Myxococcaceae bacterium]